MKSDLQINLSYQPPAVILQLSGQVGPFSHAELLAAGQVAIHSELPLLILDFSQQENLPGDALASLVQLLARLGSRGHSVYACGLKRHDRLILDLMRLTDTIKLFDNVPAVLLDYAQNHPVASLPLPVRNPNPEVGNERPSF